ncbi:MAG: hypothetical protein ACO2ZM_05470 [Francisellaceae bacterium]
MQTTQTNISAAFSYLCAIYDIKTPNIQIITPNNTKDHLQQLCTQNQLRICQVALEDKWWKNAGFYYISIHNGKAHVLLPNKNGYNAYDPQSGRSIKINTHNEAQFTHEVYQITPSLIKTDYSIKNLMKLAYGTRAK